jgi:hypothetical protein
MLLIGRDAPAFPHYPVMLRKGPLCVISGLSIHSWGRDMPKSNAIPVEYFPALDGSMSSSDGQTFYLKAEREDGSAVMLGFPHREIPSIVELAAIQVAHGKARDGGKVLSGFNVTSFELSKGEEGETVLSLTVGKTGNVNFILPADLEGQLFDALGRSMVRH